MTPPPVQKLSSDRKSSLVSSAIVLFILLSTLFGNTFNGYLLSVFVFTTFVLFLAAKLTHQLPTISVKSLIVQSILIISFCISVIGSISLGNSLILLPIFLSTLVLFNIARPHLNKIITYLLPVTAIYTIFFLLVRFDIPLPVAIRNNDLINYVWGHSKISYMIALSLLISLYSRRYLLSTFFTLSLFLSSSRASLLAVIVGLVFLNRNTLAKKKFLIPIIAFFVFLAAFPSVINSKKTFLASRLDYWSQAITGFIQKPIFGTGPGTFFYLNQQYKPDTNNISYFAQSSLLNFLSDQGLIFTIVLFFTIILSLLSQRHLTLTFALGITALTNSLFDSSWSSPGMLLIALIIIFGTTNQNPISTRSKHTSFLTVIIVFSLIFASLYTVSEIFFNNRQYLNSLKFFPPNYDSHLALIQSGDLSYKQSAVEYFPMDVGILIAITQFSRLPESEDIFIRIINAEPRSNPTMYAQIGKHYLDQFQVDKLDELKTKIEQNFPIDHQSIKDVNLQFSSFFYHCALKLWRADNLSKALDYFKSAVNFSPNWALMHIELANAYYSLDAKERAIDQINKYCIAYNDPQAECLEYFKKHPAFMPPGNYQVLNLEDEFSY